MPSVSRSSFFKTLAAISCITAWSLARGSAGDLDTIGLTTLRTRDSSLTGSGVSVAMAEASVSTNATIYQPNPTTVSQSATKFTFFDNAAPYPTGNATFNPSFESWHANSVGNNFFGSSGVAPGVASIHVFYANYFLNNIINTGTNATLTLVNQSFITGNQSSSTDQIYDNYADRYKVLFVNGVNNGSTTAPPSPATMYNGIAVGLVSGGGSTGPTTLDGRSKPDIVAPSSLTSYATPYVSGSAAILIQAGKRGDGGVGTTTTSVDPRTVKALLLNGAVKPSTWTRTGTEPLDRSFGAGVLNINRSHLQLSGGNHSQTIATDTNSGTPHLPPSGVSDNVTSPIGWNYQTITNFRISGAYKDRTHDYFFDLPASTSGAYNATCTLVWHRLDGESSINNPDFFLYNASTNALVASSTSTVDNVEHLSIANLPAGRYALQVYKPASGRITTSETYALAFAFEPVPVPATPTGLTATVVSSSQINLTWTDNSTDETGFRISRSLSSDSGFSEIGTVSANATSYSDTNLNPGTPYFYRVTASSLAGESNAATATATTYTELESWRNDYFQTPENAGDAADQNDFDTDGLANLVEYGIGSDPTVHTDPTLVPTGSLEADGVSSFLTLTIPRTEKKTDITYIAEVSGDLSEWSPEVTVLADTATQLKVRDNIPTSDTNPRRFIRMRITSP